MTEKIYKEFICLASSVKNFGRSIAGKEIDGDHIGSWIRPVCDSDSSELSEAERRYKDGSTPEVLDILGVHFREKNLHPAQKENHAIDEDYYWTKKRKYSKELSKLLDTPLSLWENGYSSQSGKNDSVPIVNITAPGPSLFFISATHFSIHVTPKDLELNSAKKRVCVQFDYNGTTYLLLVTDPVIEARYLEKETGRYPLSGDIYITVSLDDESKDHYYKLAANIIGI